MIKEISNEKNDFSSKSFIFQTVAEIYRMKRKSINKKDLMFEITMEWANATHGLNKMQTQEVEFRSSFRVKMLQKYQKI